jgi:hypothetical protein
MTMLRDTQQLSIGRGFIGSIYLIVITKLQARGKIKLLLYLIKHHAIKIYGRVKYNSIHFSPQHCGCFTPKERHPFPPTHKGQKAG